MAENEPKSNNTVLKDTIEITVKHPKKDLKAILKRPNFETYKAATVALQTQEQGKVDYLAAGAILMTFCWVEGSPELENGANSSDPSIVAAYASACVDAYHELYIAFESVVKKNY